MVIYTKRAACLMILAGITCVLNPDQGVVAANHVNGLRHRDVEQRVLESSSESSSSESPSEDESCVLETFRLLGLDTYSETDPDLLNDVLTNDMLLGDLPSVQSLLGDKLVDPKELQPMLQQIYKGIVERHPLTVEFLCEALDRGYILEVDAHKHVIDRMVHHTYLLEILTNEMARDWNFMVEIRDHLLGKREAHDIPTDFMGFVLTLYHVTGQLFDPIKTATMDWVFSQYKDMRERGFLRPEEIPSRIQGLSFNILEAAITENLNNFSDNAMAGIALVVNPTEDVRMVGENRFLEYELSREWISLYQSWNLAFITGNVPYLYLLYPKLLIPAVIDAKPDEYMFNRALALWVSINYYLFAQLQQKQDYEIPNLVELTELWGEINHEEAKEFVLKNNEVELSTFGFYLGTTYGQLWDQLSVLLINSGVITQADADQLSLLLNDQGA